MPLKTGINDIYWPWNNNKRYHSYSDLSMLRIPKKTYNFGRRERKRIFGKERKKDTIKIKVPIKQWKKWDSGWKERNSYFYVEKSVCLCHLLSVIAQDKCFLHNMKYGCLSVRQVPRVKTLVLLCYVLACNYVLCFSTPNFYPSEYWPLNHIPPQYDKHAGNRTIQVSVILPNLTRIQQRKSHIDLDMALEKVIQFIYFA